MQSDLTDVGNTSAVLWCCRQTSWSMVWSSPLLLLAEVISARVLLQGMCAILIFICSHKPSKNILQYLWFSRIGKSYLLVVKNVNQCWKCSVLFNSTSTKVWCWKYSHFAFISNQRIFALLSRIKLEHSGTKGKPNWGSSSLLQVCGKSLMWVLKMSVLPALCHSCKALCVHACGFLTVNIIHWTTQDWKNTYGEH